MRTFKPSFIRDHNILSDLDSSIRNSLNFNTIIVHSDFTNSTTCINLFAKNGLKRIVRHAISCWYGLGQIKNNFEIHISYTL